MAGYGRTMATDPSPPRPPWRERLKERLTRLSERLERRRHGLSWTAVTGGGLGAAVALWPLATTVWDLLGLTRGQTWRVAAVGVCALVLATGVVGVNWKRTAPVRLAWLMLAAWALAAGTVAAMTALAWLVLDTPQWKPPGELTPKSLDAIATRAFAIVAGLGGVALLVIAYRRQRTTEADAGRAERAAEREVSKLFTDTFDSASDKLGSEHAAVRLAGVHALARLADEAPEGREDLVQMVIDVLCAYLRMPYALAPGTLPEDATDDQIAKHHERELEFASFRQVRHTIIRIISNHLREPTRWQGKNYDFTGVVFDGGNLAGAEFTGGEVSFSGAEFVGWEVSFRGARFVGGAVDFRRAEFTGGEVDFSGAEFTGGEVDFSGAEFTGGAVSFFGARFTDGTVDFFGARFVGGAVDFRRAEFTGGEVSFSGAEFTGGAVSFSGARFTDGTVDFFGARFVGGAVDFRRAEFTGGEVDFSGAEFTGGKVDFQDASGRCPIKLLEAVESGEPGVTLLPEQWQLNSTEHGEERGSESPSNASDH
ncbi:pentapeptide repeat-containing protein [Nocardiopsis sp. NPDC058631]|uniref:pentapeptide repeat-containing protein n=1 Tax=Nocardiopsis sp. NPDC058631 TaxID=3346566 RepID=UPI003650956E